MELIYIIIIIFTGSAGGGEMSAAVDLRFGSLKMCQDTAKVIADKSRGQSMVVNGKTIRIKRTECMAMLPGDYF